MAKYDWAKIKAEYVQGNVTLEELSKKYGCSFSFIQQKSAKDKWNEETKIYRRKIEEKKLEKKSTILAFESASFDANCLRPAQSAIELLEKRISEIKKKGNLSYQDTKEIEKLGAALKTFQSVGKLALGEDPEDKKANAMQSWVDLMKLADDNS